MNKAVIEERIQAAIRPAIARADRALWELQNPRPMPGRHSEEYEATWRAANPPLPRWYVIVHEVTT